MTPLTLLILSVAFTEKNNPDDYNTKQEKTAITQEANEAIDNIRSIS